MATDPEAIGLPNISIATLLEIVLPIVFTPILLVAACALLTICLDERHIDFPSQIRNCFRHRGRDIGPNPALDSETVRAQLGGEEGASGGQGISEFASDRSSQSIGDEPRILDVQITPLYGLYSQPQPQLKRPGLSRAETDGWERCTDSTASHQGVSLCTGFLPLSAEKISGGDMTTSSQPKVGNSRKPTSSTQIRISSIILMPTRPPRSLPPAFPSNPTTYDPEYVLGVSSIPYTSND